MKKKLQAFSAIVLALAFTLPAFAADKDKGKDKAKPAVTTSAEERYENLSLFQKVLHFVEQNYVEEVNNKELVYGAIKGMLETLDPHSNFLPPEIFKDMKVDTSGKFGGVGIEIGMKKNALTVVSPIEDTPAFKAGIKAGDRIVKINGESVKDWSLSEAVAKMRGKRDSEVTLHMWRDGYDKPKEYKLKRAEIKIQTVKSEDLEAGFLYARLTNFNERSTEEMKKALDGYEKKHGAIKGMVFDLRNNPGGLLDQAVDVTSLFIDEGVVVSTMGRSKETKEVKNAKKGMARKSFPVAVLVNGASASASEIVAGALQDHKRAVVMGQPTFGKGSVQQVIELQPDVGLKLTIARYYTPSGRSIQLKGIQPDLVLDEYDQKTLEQASRKSNYMREKDLKRHMNRQDADEDDVPIDEVAKADKADKDEAVQKPFVAKEDYQVRQALNYIKGYQIFKTAELKPIEEGRKTASDESKD